MYPALENVLAVKLVDELPVWVVSLPEAPFGLKVTVKLDSELNVNVAAELVAER